MRTYSMDELRDLFKAKYDDAAWKQVLAGLFGAEKLFPSPKPVELGVKEGDEGWYLGNFTTADAVSVGLFRYDIGTSSVLKRRVGLRKLVEPFLRLRFDAALVVFVDRKGTGWRFSFVSDLDGAKTSPRRFTYTFGDAAAVYNTPVERFFELQRRRLEQGAIRFEDMKDAFSVEELSIEFYRKLHDWYTWALSDEVNVTFPNKVGDLKDDREGLNVKVIRMITRILFCWFIKQKKLVPDELFDPEKLKDVLADFDPLSGKDGSYYNAILQNLFFGTLNRPIIDEEGKKRGFADGKNRSIRTLYRYREMFAKGLSDKAIIDIFSKVPFLNGGLFECLDKFQKTDLQQEDDVYLDGFSRNATKSRNGNYKYRAFVPNRLFFGTDERQPGLITLFRQYNFTIQENTSTDAEVSLDPELLGRVFENLLADYNPETQVSARNQTGSFYTPREIVDFKVEECLTAYVLEKCPDVTEEEFRAVLEGTLPKSYDAARRKRTIEALMKIRILDPGCGSGAYPMGCLLKLVEVIELLSEGEVDRYKLKLDILDKCIFGVDIQPIAMLISKLRFFISLICDQKDFDFSDPENNYGVHTLPNLETKFVAANTLVGLRNPDLLKFEDPVLGKLKERLMDVRHRHLRTAKISEKKQLRKEDESICAEILARLMDRASGVDTEKLDIYRKELAKVDDEIAALPVRMEDVVREPETDLWGEALDKDYEPGLPMKIDVNARARAKLEARRKDLEGRILKEQMAKSSEDLVAEAKRLGEWNPYDQNARAGFFDPEWMFGVKCDGEENGFDVVMGNPPYFSLSTDSQECDQFGRLLKNNQLYEACGYSTFGKSADIYCLFYERGWQLLRRGGWLCYITSNKWMRVNYGEKLRSFFINQTNPLMLIDFGAERIFKSASVDTGIMFFRKGEKNAGKTRAALATRECRKGIRAFMLKNAQTVNLNHTGSWAILSAEEMKIAEKIRQNGTPLGQLGLKMNYGLKTGFDGPMKQGGCFIINEEKRNEILAKCTTPAERKRTEALIRPILRGQDVTRFGYEHDGIYLVVTHNGNPDQGVPPIDISDYPTVKRHLDRYRADIKARSDQGVTPYNLRSCAYMDDFKKEKILWAETMRIRKDGKERFPRFSYAKEEFYTNKTCYIATGPDLLFILGVLNSSIGRYQCKNTVAILDNGGYLMQKIYIEQIRICKCEAKVKAKIRGLVEKLLAEKNPEVAEKYENELDDAVFDAYGFTASERKYILDQFKNFECGRGKRDD